MKKTQQVVKAKLIVTPKISSELKATMCEFSKACHSISKVASEGKLHRRYDIHHASYNQVREQTSLPARHVINAIAKVSEAFTRERQKQHQFKQTAALRFDARTLTFKGDFHEASLTVCPKGRVSGELQMPSASRVKLRTWKTGSADLILRNGEFYLPIAVSTEAPEVPEAMGSLGVDWGVKRVAVTSDNTFHPAKFIRHTKRQFQQTRSSLQANGSRPARRVLRRVSGREHRFVRDANHCIAKKIVAKAKASGQRIVFEDLTGIRDRDRRWMFRHLHGWSFAQLQSFTTYKALAAGVETAFVNPAYTSQGYSRCLHLGSRSSQSNFNCAHCGLRLNAEINGARGVAVRYNLMATGRYFCSLEVFQPAQSVVAGQTQAACFSLR